MSSFQPSHTPPFTPPSPALAFNTMVDELAAITGQLLALLPQQDWPRMNQLLHQRDALLARLHKQQPTVSATPEVISQLATVANHEQQLQENLLNQMARVQLACQQLRTRSQQVGHYRSEDPTPAIPAPSASRHAYFL